MSNSAFSFGSFNRSLLGFVQPLLLSIPLTVIVLGCGSGLVKPVDPTSTMPTQPTVNAITVSVNQASVVVNTTAIFAAAKQGAPVIGGTWVVVGGSINGSIDQNGLYQAPTSVPSPSTVSVGYLYSGSFYTSSITVLAATKASTIQISPSQATVQLGSTDLFVAYQGNLPVIGGQWAVSGGSSNGSIDQTGLYRAPTLLPASSTVTIVFTLASQSYTSTVQVVNPPSSNPPSQTSSLVISPAVLNNGPINITITGTGFSKGNVVLLGVVPIQTNVISSTQITATGFLDPWISGNILLTVSDISGVNAIASQSVSIAPTPVSFDAAARFSSQAAFGPRPDLVQHIQQIGFDAFITEQFSLPQVAYSPTGGAKYQFTTRAVAGTSVLRPRLALALQTFIVGRGIDFQPSVSCLETTLENDSSGNFRTLLDDVVGDPNIASLLNLVGNQASHNQTDQPNQNFARELMQLFSLGPQLLNDDGSLKLDSGGNAIPTYGQDTVLSLTRALTGWYYAPVVNSQDAAYGIDFSQPLVPVDVAHDTGAKLLFGTVPIPAGQSTVVDKQMALDAIFYHPNLPPFISHLLIQQLVTSNPSPSYIERISHIFEDDGKGVRGNLDAVVRAILLDPEARSGDVQPGTNDGFLLSPYRMQLSIQNILQNLGSDGQGDYLSASLGENTFFSPTVFYFYSPSYMVPGTKTSSPEYMVLNNISILQRSQALWGILSSQMAGFTNDWRSNSWLYQHYTTVPKMVEALNHLVYHGQMPASLQNAIISYCAQLNPYDVQTQIQSAIFLALNSDGFNVSN